MMSPAVPAATPFLRIASIPINPTEPSTINSVNGRNESCTEAVVRAVVWNVPVIVVEVVLGTKLFWSNVQEVPLGNHPEHVSTTGEVNPGVPQILKLNCAEFPALMGAMGAPEGERLKSCPPKFATIATSFVIVNVQSFSPLHVEPDQPVNPELAGCSVIVVPEV